MTQKIRLLVTGLNGVVGQALRPALKNRYEISALSRRGVEGLPVGSVFKADIADFDALTRAMKNIDVVLHLAAGGGQSSADGMKAGWDVMLRDNIIGTYNVLEAAKQSRVKRVILASSGAVANGYELDEPYKSLVSTDNHPPPDSWEMIDEYSEPKPISLYGVTKLFGEDLGRYYAATSDLSVINIRISYCLPEDVAGPGRGQANWASYRDLQQLTILCIEAPDTMKFDIFWATSDNKKLFRDNARAKKILGYCPLDGVQ